MSEEKRLPRSLDDRMVAGVSGGLAKYFDVDTTLIRLAFVILALAGGPGVLIYIVLWIVMPEEAGSAPAVVAGPAADKAPEEVAAEPEEAEGE